MSWAGLAGRGLTVSPSAAESARFGLTVSRVVVGADTEDVAAAAAALETVLRDAAEDLVVVRYPSQWARLGAAAAASGRAILPADVLMYWEIPAAALRTDAPALAAQDLRLIVPGRADDEIVGALRTVVADSFRGYGNHYTANPALDPELALAGYLEWAETSLRRNPSDVVLLARGGTPAGIATLEGSPDGRDLEILLAGMTGALQGQGLYAHLLAGIAEEAAARGFERVIISTQAHNVRAQRAWVRAGFKPFAAVTTLHAVAPPAGDSSS